MARRCANSLFISATPPCEDKLKVSYQDPGPGLFPAPRERLKADIILLTVAVVWGSAFVAQRVAALHLNPFFFNGLRFITGALVLLPFLKFTGTSKTQIGRNSTASRKDAAFILMLGLLLFSAAALQQVGIRYTTAANAGFITGLYVVLVPLILALVFRQPQAWTTWVASLLAALGLYLLSVQGGFRLALGDTLELLGALLWACHVIWLGRLVQRVEVLPLAIVQYLVCGVLSLLTAWATGGLDWTALPGVWWTVFYTGILSIGLGYTLQAVGQKTAPAADAAILLSGEAVFAAFFGWMLLGETLTARQLLGCGLMFLGMLLAQVPAFMDRRIVPHTHLHEGD